jgi:rsbT co-antagonist protein RsbR
MATDITRILRSKKKSVFEAWMRNQLSNETLREDLISNEDLRGQSEELLDILIQNLTPDNLNDVQSDSFEPVLEILSGIAMLRARQGFSPRETGLFIFSLKEALLSELQSEAKNDPKVIYEEGVKLGRLLDHFAISSFETFLKGREEIILRQVDEMAEISTPVIQVWDGILALPIIGTLDSSRTQVIMESLLEKIVATGSGIAILDISGVPAVDSLVAQHLIKTVSATRLMGAECVISGIRPEIAQTIVQLGIDLSGITTKASLANALKFAFQILNLQVKKNTLTGLNQ